MDILTPTVVIKQEDTLRERLAALEHEQWMLWAKDIMETGFNEERKQRWKELFVSYSELSEEKKELDRGWADKVITLLTQEEVLTMNGTAGKGGEWTRTGILKPKKKKDNTRGVS